MNRWHHNSLLSSGLRPLLVIACVLMLAACQSGPVARPEADVAQQPVPLEDFLVQLDAAANAGDGNRARLLLAAALETYPEAPELHLRIAEFYAAAGQSSQARAELETLVARQPNAVPALIRLGKLYIREGEREAAWQVLAQAKKVDMARVKASNQFAEVDDASPVELYNLLGILSDLAGDHEAAGSSYLTGLKIAKKPMLYANLGYSRYLAGNPGGAEWAYRQALELAPDYQPAIRNYALLQGSKGRYQTAEQLLTADGATAQDWLDLAAVATSQGHARQAQFYEEKSREAARPTSTAGEEALPPAVTAQQSAEQALPASQSLEFAIVSAAALNIREASSTYAPILGWLGRGTRVQVLESGQNWARIALPDDKDYGAAEGWVSAHYLIAQ